MGSVNIVLLRAVLAEGDSLGKDRAECSPWYVAQHEMYRFKVESRLESVALFGMRRISSSSKGGKGKEVRRN